VQLFGQRLSDRAEQELLALVDTAAVYRPQFTGNAAFFILFTPTPAIRCNQRSSRLIQSKRYASMGYDSNNRVAMRLHGYLWLTV
jgi:hypothetical protein